MSKDFIIPFNKDEGPSSFACVAKFRKLLNTKRVGHAGTLDPAASGVLPIATGQACSILRFYTEQSKRYKYKAVLGMHSDTYDREGQISPSCNPNELRRRFEAGEFSLAENKIVFPEGIISQVPPMYSAIKQKGKPLYKLARQGLEIERKARKVEVRLLNSEDALWDDSLNAPVYSAEIEVSSGFYVRSYVHDLGKALNTGSYMLSLCRTSCGGFDLADCVSEDDLERASYSERFIRFMDAVCDIMPHMPIASEEAEKISHGDPRILHKMTSRAQEAIRSFSSSKRTSTDDLGVSHTPKILTIALLYEDRVAALCECGINEDALITEDMRLKKVYPR